MGQPTHDYFNYSYKPPNFLKMSVEQRLGIDINPVFTYHNPNTISSKSNK